ncbi:hypothetical protein EW145_g2717 [Phellinidium pouzarii]|uniref:VWFA domain-containing protein n=1 Tax=Phellinidium pouzarii TaxID=167371 RepID=A0A4S4LFA2_9AGAM|nr:hypothetical protein EW145_g2717 [Phellinidium pouzarii]
MPSFDNLDNENSEDSLLDLLFIQDATASQGPYIAGARDSILEICYLLHGSGKLRKADGLQVGLLAYRDYPQESEEEFVTKSYGFTYDLEKMKSDLAGLNPEGGGDGPEALGQALDDALNMEEWRRDSTKVIVVITDAPPHGLEEWCDAFPNGAPEGYANPDPLELSRELSRSGIRLVILACEPALSEDYWYTTDLYKAMTDITAGAMYPLTNPRLLSAYIIGSVLGGIELRKLSRQHQEDVVHRYFVLKEPIDKIVKDLHAEMRRSQQKITTVDSGDIYKVSPEAAHNARVFATSSKLVDARRKLKRIKGMRFTPGYHASINTDSSDRDFSVLNITFKNTGSNTFKLKTYDSDNQKLLEKIIVNSFTYPMEFKLGVPYNFILECGRITKNFSRTFNSAQDIDVETIFSLS